MKKDIYISMYLKLLCCIIIKANVNLTTFCFMMNSESGNSLCVKVFVTGIFKIIMCMQLTLEQYSLKCMGPLIPGLFFSEHTIGPPYPQVLHLKIQSTMDQKQYFCPLVEKPQMQRADYMHCSMPFRGLNIHGFGFLHGVSGTNPLQTLWDNLSFAGIKSYM